MLARSWELGETVVTQADLAAARTVAARLGRATPAPEVVVVGDRRALGRGPTGAGIELYVIGALPPDIGGVVNVAGTRVEIRQLSAGYAAELLALTTEYRATGRRSPQLNIGPDRLRDLIGLVTGWRLVTAPDWQARFDAVDPNALRQLAIGRAALGFAAVAEDMYAALLSADLLTMVSLSASALLFGCEAVLAAAGDLDSDARFVFRRLARTPATEPWCGRLWQLCRNGFPADTAPTPAQARAVAEERLLTGNLLLSWAEVEGWAKPLARLPEPGGRLAWSGSAGPRRSPYFTPVRFAADWTLFGPTRTYRTTEAVVRLWRRLAGRPPEQAVRDLAGAEPELAARPIGDIEVAVAALRRIGAVEDSVGQSGQVWPDRDGTPATPPGLAIVPASNFH